MPSPDMLTLAAEPQWFGLPLSEFIGIVTGVLGLVVGVLAIWLAKRPKFLEYEIKASQQILSSASGDLNTNLKVLWQDDSGATHQLSRPEIHTIRIKNAGKVAISEDDLDEPVSITMPPGVTLVEAAVVEVSRSNVHAVGTIPIARGSVQKASLKPHLMNAKQWLDVRVVVDRPVQAPPQPTLGWRRFLKIEEVIEAKREAEIALSSRFKIEALVKDEDRPIRSSSIDFKSLLWERLPRVTWRRTVGVIIATYAALTLATSIIGWMSPIRATALVFSFTWTIILMFGFMSVIAFAITISLIALNYVLRPPFRALMRYLASRMRR